MNSDTNPDNRDRFETDERSPERKGDLQAQLDELGDDPAQVGVDSAGQTVSSQGLSEVRDADEESVEELVRRRSGIEAAAWKASKMRPTIRNAQPTPTKNMAILRMCLPESVMTLRKSASEFAPSARASV